MYCRRGPELQQHRLPGTQPSESLPCVLRRMQHLRYPAEMRRAFRILARTRLVAHTRDVSTSQRGKKSLGTYQEGVTKKPATSSKRHQQHAMVPGGISSVKNQNLPFRNIGASAIWLLVTDESAGISLGSSRNCLWTGPTLVCLLAVDIEDRLQSFTLRQKPKLDIPRSSLTRVCDGRATTSTSHTQTS